MELDEFARFHGQGLEADEVRHNLILSLIAEAVEGRGQRLRYWSIGSPGACAIQNPGWPIVLGDLSKAECGILAERVRDMDYPGVVGPDSSALWFADHARELGKTFMDPVPQQIYAIDEAPYYPAKIGQARRASLSDGPLLGDWMSAFHDEATPDDRKPDPARFEKPDKVHRHMFWIVDGRPVSTAAIGRNTPNCAVINAVYTPPALRGKGYAGSVTAALVENALADGKSRVCLYTDLRNPKSNRCYQRVGFKPWCQSHHCHLEKRHIGQSSSA